MANVKIKDKKIALWLLTEENKLGQIKKVYTRAYPGKIWAYYRQTGGNKTLTNAGVVFVNTVEDCIFIINKRKNIDTSMIIVYNHKIYEIQNINDNEGYNTDIVINCKLAENQNFSSYNGLTDD